MNALTIKNLEKQYSNGPKALKGISFEVKAGDFFALLGPNGAGKSTTIGIISNLVNKTAGEVKIFDYDIQKNPNEAKAALGLVPQEINLNIFETVIDIIVNQAGYYGMPRKEALKRAEELLKQLNLWEKRDTKSMALSGGMKRKLMIIRALMHRPRLLILDEPTAGVDVESRREMWEFLKELNESGTTIILTTHYLEEAENLCENIAIINHGEIAENTTIKKLITSLDQETFLLDIEASLKKAPEVKNYTLELADENTLKVAIPKDQSINDLMKQLSDQNINVLSMRNETNRLEELFIRLTQN